MSETPTPRSELPRRSSEVFRQVLRGCLGLLLGFSVGCERVVAEAPLVTLPLPGEEISPPSASASAAPVPSASAAPPELSPESRAPDPEAVATREFFELELEFAGGGARVLRSRFVDREAPEFPARRVGRFAIELFAGAELVERVRFDFPLLASTDDAFEPGLRSRTVVLLPRRPEVTRAILLDRKTSRFEVLPYDEWFSPPTAP